MTSKARSVMVALLVVLFLGLVYVEVGNRHRLDALEQALQAQLAASRSSASELSSILAGSRLREAVEEVYPDSAEAEAEEVVVAVEGKGGKGDRNAAANAAAVAAASKFIKPVSFRKNSLPKDLTEKPLTETERKALREKALSSKEAMLVLQKNAETYNFPFANESSSNVDHM